MSISKEALINAACIAGIIAVIGTVGTVIYKSCENDNCGAPAANQSAASAPAAKPQTLTRCDYTGVMASSIIVTMA
jgi:hypothetical protein